MRLCSNILIIFVTIHCSIHFSIPTSHDESAKSKRRLKRHKWTQEEEAVLIFLDESTKEGAGRHFDRIKAGWHRFFENSDITDDALQGKISRLREESMEAEHIRRHLKWNQGLEKELLEVYFNTSPYRADAAMTLEGEWKRRHPNHRAEEETLIRRVRKLLGGLPKYKEGESSHVDFEWEEQHDSDLSHAEHVALSEGKHHMRRTHSIWSELYPQYSHITHEQLKERMNHLKKYPPNQYFPWTEKENEQLYNIFRETMPDKEDQGQRVHDSWAKIHPRYSFMTPYYLQVHASKLARDKESEVAGGPTRTVWTNEMKSDLVDIYRRYSEARNGLIEFHKEWVCKYPRLAYQTIDNLGKLARKFADQGYSSTSREIGEGSSRRQYNTYTPEDKRNLFVMYDRTSPKKYGHSKRLMEQYKAEYKDHLPIEPKSLKELVRRWREEEPKKQDGKGITPMVDPSDEPESSSTPRMLRGSAKRS